MSKASCDANQVLKLQAEIERQQAEAAAMREALEEIDSRARNPAFRKEHTLSQICSVWDDIHYNVIVPALAADAGRKLLEQLRQAERERDEALEIARQAGHAAAGQRDGAGMGTGGGLSGRLDR